MPVCAAASGAGNMLGSSVMVEGSQNIQVHACCCVRLKLLPLLVHNVLTCSSVTAWAAEKEAVLPATCLD